MRAELNVDIEAIEQQLRRVLRSKVFATSRRSQDFLEYVVANSLSASSSSPPKEYAIAVDVFGRDPGYDPSIDATVRVEAGRLRARLRDYYDTEGKDDPILIEIPKGAYAPAFTVREATAAAASPIGAGTLALNPIPQPILSATPAAQATPAEQSPPRSLSFPSRTWIPLGALSVLLVAGALVYHRVYQSAPIHSLVVLPLENLSADPNMEYFADGMTDQLTTELALLPQLRVVSHTSAMQEKGKRDSLEQIARKLNVDAVVEGSIIRSDNTIRLNIQLIDARTDRHLWAGIFDEPQTDVLGLQDHVAREIAAHARVVLTPLGKAGDIKRVDPAAYDAYLRGRYFIDRREPGKALAYFRQAVSIDPTYAPAYSGLAAAFDSAALLSGTPSTEVLPQAIAAANRAIQLDPANGEAWSVLGIIASDWQWDWKTAEHDLQHAIALTPNDSAAELRYATFLSAMGRNDESVRHMQRALDLDPLSFWNTRQMGTILYWAHRYDEALHYLHLAAEVEPSRAALTENWASHVYAMQDRKDQSVSSDLAAESRLPPPLLEHLRSAYATGGWNAYWQARLDLMKPNPTSDCAPFGHATIYAQLHDADQTILWLNRAIDRRCYYSTTLKSEPLFDFLHNDPRFANLLQRVGLPK